MMPPEPTNNFTDYRAAVAEALTQSPREWTFKGDPRYRRILEHVTPEQGAEFYALIEAEFPGLFDDLQTRRLIESMVYLSDTHGMAELAPLPPHGYLGSPSNYRYLYHALLILRHAESLGLKQYHIVEVGGGYGGLAYFINRFVNRFASWPSSHTVIDLPEVAALQAKYAAALDFPLHTVNGLDAEAIDTALLPDDGPPRYFVSIYAFSEFDAETRAWYEERVARRCAHGFLVWNFYQPLEGVAEKRLGGPLYPFVDAPLETEPERPNTGPGNLMVRF